MKTMIRLLLCAVLVCVFLVPQAAAARPMEYFTISNYDVSITVSDSKMLSVVETITVQFSEPRHGIYRRIPYKGTLYRENEGGGRETADFRTVISDIAVEGFDHSVSREGSDVILKIGNADYYVEGEQVYRISYKMQYGDDFASGFDELYQNIVGTEWDTTIDRVSFAVTMPTGFDESRLGFSTGSYGASGYDPGLLKFSVDGNTITGYTTGRLSNYEGVTMRLTLPQGYFRVVELRVADVVLAGVILLLTLGSAALFFLYGRDEQPVQTVEFNAPDGMTPAEVGYVIDGCVDNRDVVSLLMHWADQGYLTIEDAGGGEFKLHKVRDMDDGRKAFERHMFNKLFKSGAVVSTGDLRNTFYKTIASTKTMVTDSFERKDRMVFTKLSMNLRPLLSFVTALPVMMTMALEFYRDTGNLMETVIMAGLLGILILLPVYFLIGTMRAWRGQKPAVRMVKLFSFLFLCLIAVVFFLMLTSGALLPVLPWTAALATVVIGLTAVFISRRTPKGTEWLGKIMGFHDFIVLAERDKLLQLVEQNPGYFYNVLPYAYVLGITDKWAKNFESIALEPPQWYSGYAGQFHPVLFVGSLNHSMSTFQSQMTSTPSSSGGGGGGFSGGGFSGGGGGGGGGGSW